MLNEEYWTSRYEEGTTGWDLGAPSRPLMEFCEKEVLTHQTVLIPGAGRGHDAEALHHNGYSQVHVLDYSPLPLQDLAKRLPSFPVDHLIAENFFSHTGSYDVVLEQTFFCALSPALRPHYVTQMARLIKPGGLLAGVLFDFPLEQGPPFGGSAEEYLDLLNPRFDIHVLEPCRNSMPGREGKELFLKAERKKNPAG